MQIKIGKRKVWNDGAEKKKASKSDSRSKKMEGALEVS